MSERGFDPVAPPRRMARGPRALAVVLWSGFVGAVVAMPLYYWAHGQALDGIGPLSALFLLAWLAACVPALQVWLLAPRPPSDRPTCTDDERAP